MNQVEGTICMNSETFQISIHMKV